MPKGVFNLVNGLGPEVGAAMSAHPGIDMISFTGSTRAGIDVAKRAAPTVKRVSQELGGKSPNIILDDADLAKAVTGGVHALFQQLRPVLQRADADDGAAVEDEGGRRRIAKASPTRPRSAIRRAEGTTIGPVVSRIQWDKIQALIEKGIDEGATLVTGGPGLPGGRQQGLLCPPDRVRRRHQRHDHRARGDLRARALDHRRPRTRPTR